MNYNLTGYRKQSSKTCLNRNVKKLKSCKNRTLNSGCDRMEVGFITNCAISASHH